ncbi:MAG: CBS domain-containing protein [Desulforhopalus sp.]|nr:CBS domain-containing protein [Desulforhopalus sp.]
MAETLKVRQAVKRKFPVIDMEDSLEMAIQLMAETNVSVLAVKVASELVGLVTVWDVLNGLAHDYDRQATKISTFMTKCEFHTDKSTKNACIQLDENEELFSAIKVMYEAGVNHLLVTGERGKPVGIVSSLELIKLAAASSSLP